MYKGLKIYHVRKSVRQKSEDFFGVGHLRVHENKNTGDTRVFVCICFRLQCLIFVSFLDSWRCSFVSFLHSWRHHRHHDNNKKCATCVGFLAVSELLWHVLYRTIRIIILFNCSLGVTWHTFMFSKFQQLQIWFFKEKPSSSVYSYFNTYTFVLEKQNSDHRCFCL